MDRKCKGCKYRVFRQDDTYTKWGFCACRDIPKGKNITKSAFGLVCADDHSRDVLSKLHKDEIPSCMIVQSFYDGDCPYYESDSLVAALENKLRDAEAAKIRAELEAKMAKEDAERIQKEIKTSAPDVAEFKALFDELQALAVKCLSAIRKIKGRDPKVGEGCEKALRAFGEKL